MKDGEQIPWDIEYVRSRFPAFHDPATARLSFFENAGGTYAPNAVIERLADFMTRTKVQPYGPYHSSREATRAIEQATVKMAEMINADEDEVVVGHSTTMNLYVFSMSLREQFNDGDEIIVTEQDHEANVSPWLRLQSSGVCVRVWRVDQQTGSLSLDDLEALLCDRTRLVCMTHSSNVVGDVNPVRDVADRVHRIGAWLLVDGVSYAPHHAIDVKALGADVYVLSLYKLFGPHLGLMFVDRGLHSLLANQSLEQLPSLYVRYRSAGAPNFLRIALNPGLVNHEECAALLGLVDYFEDLHRHHRLPMTESFNDRVRAVMTLAASHEEVLARQWMGWLNEHDQLGLVGSTSTDLNRRSPTWTLRCPGQDPRALALALGDRDVAVQSGGFYAWRCLRGLGVDPERGLLRVSLAHFNSDSEMSNLCNALETVTSSD